MFTAKNGVGTCYQANPYQVTFFRVFAVASGFVTVLPTLEDITVCQLLESVQ